MPEPDDLTAHSVEWVADTVDRWIDANELAQQIQRSMPLYVHERLSLLPEGHDALPMAMAMAMRPEAIREAHEWLVSAKAQISVVARLSHPIVKMDAKTDAENGATVDYKAEAERLAARVAELEHETERYRTALRMVEGVSARGLAGRLDRLEHEVDVGRQDRAVGF